ncbi:MAG TPA: WecB/TagA/CpsF family glycosyltransferase [Anaerolineales bacterium]|nr:WecB/TagA/CpsF family glycosyltransferase [Anaerolineales bacterium]
MKNHSILGVPIDATSYARATDQILAWTRAGGGHCVYAANVHVLIEAQDHADFMELLRRADLVTPDGMPLVWMLRLKGVRSQPRVYGPDLMLRLLAAAAQAGIPVGFYGGAPEILEALVARMQARFPGLNVPYAYSPPFRPLAAQEDAEIIEAIRAAGVRILFVGLGCPKQERWVDAHRENVAAVMVAVGAAFDFLAGNKHQAPAWMQRAGLEWLFRLFQEPGRLWKRYVSTNPRFILLALLELLRKEP